jgi:ElaB/YqjD/DUF883 family membrane-anchored ribosome-binding protein
MPAEPTVHNLREQVKSIERDEAADRRAASAAISDTVDQVAATAEGAVQTLNEKYQKVSETIRTHPVAYVLGAAAVGIILGRAWG